MGFYPLRGLYDWFGQRLASALSLLFDFDGGRHTLLHGLPHQILVLLRNLVEFDDGQQLVLLIFENVRTTPAAGTVAMHCLLIRTFIGSFFC